MKKIFFLLLIFASPLLAFSQLTDNFSDGDFTSNPVWSGDATEFTVNASQQLQLNNTVAGSSYLSTPNSTSLNDLEWRFYIKQSFAPSSSNYGRVYLASDQANLEGALNGYYLQFGEAGTLDAVQLFKQTGTTSASIARGTDAQIAASFTLGIKVTRNASGLWSLFVDPAGGNNYSLQATGTETTYNTSLFFGVLSVYTASNSTKFFFDDFYVGPIIIDNTAPTITSISVISSTQIDVTFNETLETTSAETISNYSANNGIGNPATAAKDATSQNLVHLTFTTPFSDGILNTLTVTNVKDLSNNSIVSETGTFTYIAPVFASFKDVIINEIFADPSPEIALPLVEFVELYNKSSKNLNLTGWTFSDGTTTGTLGNKILLSNEYLILCKTSDTALFTGYGNTLGLSSFPSLNNSGDKLLLKNNNGSVIDSLTYALSWYKDLVKDDGGWTLELINPNANVNCSEESNWKASSDPTGGTPAKINSVFSTLPDSIAPAISSVSIVDSLHMKVCFSEPLSFTPSFNINNGIGNASGVLDSLKTCADLTLNQKLGKGVYYLLTISGALDCEGNTNSLSYNFVDYNAKTFDVIINEIMADPDPAIALPEYEYIELYNRSSYPIDLTNWQITAGTNTKTLPSVSIQPNNYLLLTSTTGTSAFAGLNVVGVTSFPSLTNTGQTLIISDALNNVIHTVTYSDNWYNDQNKAEGGWSLELINPNAPCAELTNWSASNSSQGGTPGKQNSVMQLSVETDLPEITRVSIINPSTIQVYFNESTDSTSLFSAQYSIDNSISVNGIDPVGPAYKSVILSLANSLAEKVIYTITVIQVKDCVGNLIGSKNTGVFAIPEPILQNDIVINEILSNPPETGVDFIEIYNRSNKVLDLKNLSVSSMDTITNALESVYAISPEGYLLFPGEYLVLTSNPEAIKKNYVIKNEDAFLETSIPSLSIAADAAVLSDSAGTIIDKVIYYESWQFPLLNSTKGVSLERIDFDRSSTDATNWHSASETAGFATPGYVNSQFKKAETGTEVTLSPQTFSPDNDGIDDVININYAFDKPGAVANIVIYDVKGRQIRNLVKNELLGSTGTISWDGINDDNEKSRIGIYIIYFEIFDISGKVESFKKPCVLAGKF